MSWMHLSALSLSLPLPLSFSLSLSIYLYISLHSLTLYLFLIDIFAFLFTGSETSLWPMSVRRSVCLDFLKEGSFTSIFLALVFCINFLPWNVRISERITKYFRVQQSIRPAQVRRYKYGIVILLYFEIMKLWQTDRRTNQQTDTRIRDITLPIKGLWHELLTLLFFYFNENSYFRGVYRARAGRLDYAQSHLSAPPVSPYSGIKKSFAPQLTWNPVYAPTFV